MARDGHRRGSRGADQSSVVTDKEVGWRFLKRERGDWERESERFRKGKSDGEY